jgi:hypothetical protein
MQPPRTEEVQAQTVAMARCRCGTICSAVFRRGNYVMSKSNCPHAISARQENGAPVMRFAYDE